MPTRCMTICTYSGIAIVGNAIFICCNTILSNRCTLITLRFAIITNS